ncbi:FG-GAP and VCBS repeat-containing protein [Dokdonella koreensis]|uniref:FG-GAP repeat domain protein n=1 Tax=Dokdonella koreensis DS-123 TaxID=1300342 RepID=A0A160DSL7_9GAMM|nr:FG-GAP and VCBS repeat-containing protein [Dokdonella koreensis]ANB17308.1 FG-GAP repeat domain protein [Dokdonella koreensis DS-123]
MTIDVLPGGVRAGRIALWLVIALAAGPAPAADQLGTHRNILLRNPYPEAANGQFGRGIAGGDFDGDGIDDLAVSENGSTRLRIAYGTAWSLATAAPVIPFLPVTITLPAHSYTMTAGDFDDDGRDELAVANPQRNIGGAPGVGSVYIMKRGSNGIWSVQTEIRAGGVFPGSGLQNANLGNALASGDFDDDGYADLAIGIRGQLVQGQEDAGAVMVVYGSAGGLAPPRARIFDRSNDGLSFTPRATDRFGWAVTAGDFNGDGYDELAVGVRGATCPNGTDRAGAVIVLAGSATGIVTTGTHIWRPGVLGVAGSCTSGQTFGSALAAGRFDDTHQGLAIGAPGAQGGAVHVLYGSDDGLTAVNNQRLVPPAVPGIDSSDGHFGETLAAGTLAYRCEFIFCLPQSLAIGAPMTAVDGVERAGAVWIVTPRMLLGPLDPGTLRAILPKAPLRIGSPRANDQFGNALAIGDFNDDSRRDLAIGTYLYDDADADAGAVQLLYQGDYLFVDPFE